MARRSRLVPTPMAIASDGALLLNVHYMTKAEEPDAVLAEAVKTRRAIFVGVALTDAEGVELLRDLEDGVADSVARVGARFLSRRRGR